MKRGAKYFFPKNSEFFSYGKIKVNFLLTLFFPLTTLCLGGVNVGKRLRNFVNADEAFTFAFTFTFAAIRIKCTMFQVIM